MSEKIKQLLKRSGLKPDVFAEKLGVSRDTLKSYMSGRLRVPEERMKLAEKIVKKIEKI
jgi:DNA-binding transcriptional regulator YiaG